MKQVLAYLLAAMLIAPSGAYALGLGNLQRKSQLNQPFSATIELIDAKADEVDSLSVKLADTERFRRAGLERPQVLSQLRFEVIQPEHGPDYIKITSHEPIREPFLNFLIEVNWPKGRLFREYTALLDPPGYDPNFNKMAPAQPTRPPPAPSHARGADRADVQSRVREPAVEPSRPTPAAPVPEGTPPQFSPGGGYGPTRSGDTLWAIAAKVRSDRSVSMQQMMLALLRANPQAFFLEHNMNALRKGVVLNVPESAAMSAASKTEALDQVRRHHALWEEYRQISARSASSRPIGGATSQGRTGASKAPVVAAPDEAHLKLLSAADANTSPGVAAPGQGAKGGPNLARDLALANETLEAKRQENAELGSKLAEADGLVKLLQRQIEVKNQDLATLQEKLGALDRQLVAQGADKPVEVPKDAQTSGSVESTAEGKQAEGSRDTTKELAGVAGATATEPTKAGAQPSSSGPIGVPVEAVQSTPPPAVDTSPVPRPPAMGPAGKGAVGEPVRSQGVFDNIPGGFVTVGGVAAAVLLAVVGLVRVRSRREPSEPAFDLALPERPDKSGVKRAPLAAEEVPSVVPGGRVVPKPKAVAADIGDATQAPDLGLLLGKEQARAPALAKAEEDPLAEVNVYLAYERFDEAERRVKQAIQEAPSQQNFKLRLLEVYYSAGNQAAYENYAKVLHDAVAGKGPLWDSAVAMWREMSPARGLFEDRGERSNEQQKVESSKFVDITSAAAGVGTAVAAGMAAPHAGLDFDLGAAAPSELAPGESAAVFDISGDSGTAGDVLDITAGEGGPAADHEFLDLTALGTEGEPGGAETASGAGVFDITAGAEEDASTLLDVTASGDITGAEHGDLLDLGATVAYTREAEERQLTAPEQLHVISSEDAGYVLDLETGSAHEPGAAVAEHDLEIEFDLSDMPVDRTQVGTEAPVDTAPLSIDDDDRTLVELTHSLEESVGRTGWGQAADPVDIDLFAATSPVQPGGVEDRVDQAGARHEHAEEQTIDIRGREGGDEQAIGDEIATRLDLAKAYIDLGDADGARTIIDEVMREGNEAQRQEAEKLLRELSKP